MENSTTTPLTGVLLAETQLELVASTTVAGTLYGIAFTLFCIYVHALAPRLQNGDRKRQAKIMVAYSTIIMLCGLYNLVFNAWTLQDAYIKHSRYLGGPLLYLISTITTSPVTWVGYSCQVAIDMLASAIQVWRVWVIWSATRYATLVVVLPVLCLLTFVGLRLRTMILQSTLPNAEDVQLDRNTDQAGIAIQGATTILCTLLISSYLIFKQWQQRRLIRENQGFTGYMNVVAIIVESYALESGWLLAMVVIRNSPTQVFFGESLPYVEIIAYLLVQYRVAKGQSYGSQRAQKNISSMRWNQSTATRTHPVQASEIQASPHVSAIPAASEVARTSSMA